MMKGYGGKGKGGKMMMDEKDMMMGDMGGKMSPKGMGGDMKAKAAGKGGKKKGKKK